MYRFPCIEHINHVLPHIDDNFKVSKTDYGLTFINYLVASIETFPPITDLRSKIRRECRGIAFDTQSGLVVSRPFHKFFNVGEREDEQFPLGWWKKAQPQEKYDGSMIRPLKLPEGIRLGTKAGVTDVSMLAEEYIADKGNYLSFLEECMTRGLTPIFEYVAPNNKIVLEYSKPELILLDIRNNVTGEYYGVDYLGLSSKNGIPCVVNSPWSIDTIREREDREGIVFSGIDGHKVKIKADWYVKLHRAKELMSRERRLVGMILDNELDDVLPVIDEDNHKKIEAFRDALVSHLEERGVALEFMYRFSSSRVETKKDFAIASNHPSPYYSYPAYRSGIFALWDKKVDSGYEYWLQYLKKNLATQRKFEEVQKLLELPKLEDYDGKLC